MMHSLYTLPFFLTSLRLLSSFFILPFLIFYLEPYNSLFLNGIVTLIFLICGATDFFDGYLARIYNQESDLGRFLDPLADKVFVMATMVSLLAIGKLGFYWIIMLLSREFFVTSLREVAQYQGFSVPVAYAGKFKTFVQMIVLACILMNPYQSMGSASWWNYVEGWFLFVAVLLAWVSAFFYVFDYMSTKARHNR